MKCLNRDCAASKIENDDNFCYKCGHWTAKGFSFISKKENIETIMSGEAVKKDGNFSLMVVVLIFAFIMLFIFSLIRGSDLYKPFFYLKRQINNYIYGYNTSIIKTDNTYRGRTVNNYEDAIKLIKKDLDSQNWKCSHRLETLKYQNKIENIGSIPVVSFCDISDLEAQKLTEVIERMYSLFPNMKGALTNISITNAISNSEYIARFQPMFQFVNATENINHYNKVNKTQILLNSYYFLNDDIINNPLSSVVDDDWYVKDANWESVIAHEFGHYISFSAFLKQNGLKNITFVTLENEEKLNNIMSRFDNGEFSELIVRQALNNYNNKYGTNLDLNSFALTISKYAGTKDDNNNLIADETIAEAIHDYYLHGTSLAKSSYEIVNIIKSKL